MENETETEVKIPVADASSALARFDKAGLQVSVPRVFESNTLYDTRDQALRRSGTLLRLRQVGDRAVLTWKGVTGKGGPHKQRPELETSIGSIEVLGRILGNLGYQPLFRYEKYRTEFRGASGEGGVVTLDETPIGTFLEIEGSGDWIDTMAAKLGFSRRNYVLDSYGKLYVDYCAKHGLEPSHMVFASST